MRVISALARAESLLDFVTILPPDLHLRGEVLVVLGPERPQVVLNPTVTSRELVVQYHR